MLHWKKNIFRIPGLQAHRCGKNVTLTIGEVSTEAGLAKLLYTDDDDGRTLVQAAKRIRQDLFNNETNWNSILIKILKKKMFRPNELITNDIRGDKMLAKHETKVLVICSLLNLMPLAKNVSKVLYIYDTRILKKLLWQYILG